MEPQKFGRYEIRGEIGRGGMATVYHAWDPRFEREVALKVLPHEMLHDVQFRARFEREAKTIAMLEHPAIVPVYDFGEEDGQPYFVMRYMTGGSLSDRMKKGPMNIQEVARLIAHIAPALDEAHSKGIIHRDLKPGNILFDQYNEPYVSDFGIAKISTAQTQVTGSAIVGTPAYMSPEQAQGETIDGRSDIYGLGVILFELLSGRQPYQGDTPMSVVVKHITDPVPHILDVKPDLPADLELVVEKAMAKDRNERFQNVQSLADALTAVAHGEHPDLAGEAVTMVKGGQTIIRKKPGQAAVKTVLNAKGEVVPVKPASSGMGTGTWIGIGVAVVLLLAIIGGVALALSGKLSIFARPEPTQTKIVLPPTFTVEPPTATLPPVLPTVTETPKPVETETPAPTSTATVPPLPVVGGADMLAFLSDNNIWTADMNGGQLQQITKDNTEKHDLQWAPDGQSLFYISGKCIHYVTAATGEDVNVTCFTAASYLEAFEISPDGKQVAISLDRVMYIVPFELKTISAARNWMSLRDMPNKCLTYGYDQATRSNQPGIKQVRWSGDGRLIAANTLGVSASGNRVDLILVFDVSKCANVAGWLDNFPGSRFTMTNFNSKPLIPYFSWSQDGIFLLNSMMRYNAGYLYAYNFQNEVKKNAVPVTPLKTCCYQAATWGPDGSVFAFHYLDINTNQTDLYIVQYGSLGTGMSYEPLDLPDTLFTKPGAVIEIAFRKVK